MKSRSTICPALTVTACVWGVTPVRYAFTVTAPAGTPESRSWPAAAVNVSRAVRSRVIGVRSREGLAEPSLATLVHAKNPAADVHARAALVDAEAALLGIPEPFTDALTDSPETVQAAYDSLKALKRVLATEVLSSLGASLKFSDNDGD